MAGLEIVPFSDAHLDDAAALLAARHARHREAEPLLPERRRLPRGGRARMAPGGRVGACFARRARLPDRGAARRCAGTTWMRVGIAGQAIEGDREPMRDLYAAAAQRWVDDGLTRSTTSSSRRTTPSSSTPGSGSASVPRHVLAMRETDRAGGAVRRPASTIRRGDAGRLRRGGAARARADAARCSRRRASPSFRLQTHEEIAAEWREDDDGDTFELFVAERDGRIVGHAAALPPAATTCACRRTRIDLAQASTEPEARGTGVGRALTDARDPLGARARLPGDDDRLADDEPLGVALLAKARLPTGVPAALPLDSVVQRVPLLVRHAPDRRRRARRCGRAAAAAARRAGRRRARGGARRAALPARRRAAGGARDARRAGDDRRRAAGAAAPGRAQRPAAGGARSRLGRARAGRHPDRAADAARRRRASTRRPQRRELERLGIVSPGFARRFRGTVEIHDAESPELVELEPPGSTPLAVHPRARRHRPRA